MTGTWRVSPPGRFWVNGSWNRDEQGWYRVPGFWSERKNDVRRDGPPGVGREDRTGPAPGPDSFLIPGQYVPAGDGVVWRPGFWARSQPGWEWVPARWVRLSEGWTYREGHWERSTADLSTRTAPARDAAPTAGATSVSESLNAARPGPSRSLDPTSRHRVARPLPGTMSPFVADATTRERGPDPDVSPDHQPLPDASLQPIPDEGRGPFATPNEGLQPTPDPNPNAVFPRAG